MMDEPSVLDYVIAKLTFWQKTSIEIPELPAENAAASAVAGEVASIEVDAIDAQNERLTFSKSEDNPYLWEKLLALVPVILALAGQFALEPPRRSIKIGVVFYALAVISLVWLIIRKKWQIAPYPTLERESESDFFSYQMGWLVFGGALFILAFIFLGGNRFTILNLFLWGMTLFAFLKAFWIDEGWLKKLSLGWSKFWRHGVRFSPWALLVIATFGVIVFFRFYQLGEVPPEMFSDHAEKLLDVADVLNGQYSIFFPRNTGREAIQMYLTAAVVKIFGTGLSFMSLKIGTVLAGLVILPYIYLLGKEIGNRWVGLLAMLLTGMAYWPNVLSRVALRFSLYPLFVAPLLYYLIRGLRHRRRNDFLYAGIALGLGLHGYSSFRVVPLTVIVAFVVYFFHQRSTKKRKEALLALGLVVLVSLVVFLPLLRYTATNYDSFMYRAMTRMSDAEHALPGNAIVIFFQNLWKAIIMFQWENGNTWVHSVPGRPALGIVSAVLFSLGVVTLIVRYVRKRYWLDLFLLLSVPLLLLASVLALAFPIENPCLNRTGGAIIPVFLIAGTALEGLARSLKFQFSSRWGKGFAWSVVGVLLALSAIQNYDLVFHDYHDQFESSAWNTSELGAVIRQFDDTIGEDDHVWVVPYPYWVDTRLVGVWAGYPLKDYALWRDDIPYTKNLTGPKLFLYKPEDAETEETLRQLYPGGVEKLYEAEYVGQNFVMYFVLSPGDVD
ncbi:MAG: hypothetical protein DRI56_03625 [Chloroflexota bacterium]|nr:MAG: hypothetical protein DRI56_03625 [Chloroflexota bacterium]